LSHGIRAFDITEEASFALHAYLILEGADQPAMAKFLHQKGPGATCGCGKCTAHGVQMRTATITAKGNLAKRPPTNYYLPNCAPDSHDDEERRPDLDPRNLPLRNEIQYLDHLQEIQNAQSKGERADLAQKYGINSESILIGLSSFDITQCAPRDFMHVFYEHMIPMLISFWKGAYKPWKAKNLDLGQPYVIPKEKWDEIGKLTADASKLLPGSFCRALPNIWKEEHHYIAETYGVWMAHLAPKLLRNCWPDHPKYYDHAVLASKILLLAESFETPRDSIKPGGELYEAIQTFVQQYFEYVSTSLLKD
jgi:hypothetical protein